MSVLNIKQFLLLEAIVIAFTITETVQARDLQNPTNNFTTYQLKVPGSHDQITIIEDITHSSELSDVSGENVNRDNEKKMLTRRNGDHLTEKELVSISPSAQQRLNTRNQDVRATLSFQISDPDKSNDNEDGHKKKDTYSPSLLKKFIKDYSEKIKNADESTKNALKEIEKMNQKYTTPEDEVTTDRMDFGSSDEIEQKYNKWNDRYSNKHQSQSNPYNDKDGWVTLEAVPWSSSKVSKWYPHSNKFNNKNSYDSPLSHQPSYEDDDDKYHQPFPKPRPPPSHYHDDFNDDYIDDHPTLKPAVYTSYEPHRQPQTNNRPQYSWSQNQNTGFEKRPTQKLRPRPQYDYGQSSSNNHQSYDDDDRHESNEHWYDVDRNTPKPWSQDIITDNRPSDFPYRAPSKRPHSSDRDPTKYRPFSHPENGDGEWVLVSTTKGYQTPKRNGKRMNLPNNQPNDLLSHHSVKLTVLPPKNNTFSYDRKPMTLSHGGMLEVESSFESVEDSAALASSGNRPFVVKKRKVVRNIPMKKGMTSTDDGSAVLAAVGAGMVPATMAMLMPMVLGRRRRAVYNSFVPNGTLVM